MKSLLHDYLSDSEDESRSGNASGESPLGVRVSPSLLCREEASVDSESKTQDRGGAGRSSSGSNREAGPSEQRPGGTGVQKNIQKKKNKYLNEFLQASALENIKTLGARDLKRPHLDSCSSSAESRVGKTGALGELKQSVNQKRKHQITWLLSEAKQLRSESNSKI